jgi:hypothetical protein
VLIFINIPKRDKSQEKVEINYGVIKKLQKMIMPHPCGRLEVE